MNEAFFQAFVDELRKLATNGLPGAQHPGMPTAEQKKFEEQRKWWGMPNTKVTGAPKPGMQQGQ